MRQLPIVCSLSQAELEVRRAGWREKLYSKIQERTTLDDGFAFRFGADTDTLRSIFELIDQERACCGFLEFDLRVTQDRGPVWLEIRGPQGAKAFIDEIFDP